MDEQRQHAEFLPSEQKSHESSEQPILLALSASLQAIDAGPVRLPQRTLLVLCGIPGSGKSTFANHLITHLSLPPTTIVSSDYCRALVCDDDSNQQVSRDAFDLLHFILYKRMLQGRFTIADSTALLSNARRRLFEQAHSQHYATCLLVFTTDPAISIQRDRARQRIVGETIIHNLQLLLEQALRDIPHESWNRVYRVDITSSPSSIFIDKNNDINDNDTMVVST